MIFVNETSTSLDTAAYFATKREDIPVVFLEDSVTDPDFCTCIQQCIPCLKVFTDETGSDFWKNDKFQVFLNVASGTTVTYTLFFTDGSGTQEINVTDGTYGTLNDGSSSTPAYVMYELDFYKIWDNLGYGEVSFRIASDNGDGTRIQQVDSPCFKIYRYSDRLANGTVRIETTQSGNILSGNKYGSFQFSQQIRLPGSLKFTGNTTESDRLVLNGDIRNQIVVKDQVFPTYDLEIRLASSAQVWFLMFDYLFSGSVKISDYNLYNYVVDPKNRAAAFYRSIPVDRVDEDHNSEGMRNRKTTVFKLEYGNKNVFKTEN